MYYSAMETGNYPNVTILSLNYRNSYPVKFLIFFFLFFVFFFYFFFLVYFEDEIDPSERADIETLPNHYDAFIIVIGESESRWCLQLIIIIMNITVNILSAGGERSLKRWCDEPGRRAHGVTHQKSRNNDTQ